VRGPPARRTHARALTRRRDTVAPRLLVQFVNDWLKKGQHYPVELHEKAYKAGIQGVLYPKEVGGTRPDDFDAFHEVILWDELGR
jgi:hypothetical protein